MSETLTRGTLYTLSTPCQYCGEATAAFLARLRTTPEDRAAQLCCCVFLCRSCHAARTMRFRAPESESAPR